MPHGRNEPALAWGRQKHPAEVLCLPMGWGSCSQQPQALEQHPAPTAVFTAGFSIWAVPGKIQNRPKDPHLASSSQRSGHLHCAPHTYLEGAIAEEHEQGLVSLHPLQEEQGWLP